MRGECEHGALRRSCDRCEMAAELTRLRAEVEALQKGGKNDLLSWACGRWREEVQDRPLVNKHRRSLDDTWRQVVRYAGGDPDELLGPPHDVLLQRAAIDAAKGGEHCRYPDCNCPFDAPADPNWCAKGLPRQAKGGGNG